MVLLVHGLQAPLIDMRVNLSGRNIGVAEQFLDHTQISPVREKVRGKRMPEQVRVDVRFDPCQFRTLPGNLPDSLCRELCPTH